MTLPEKIKRVKEIHDLMDKQQKLPLKERLSDSEFLILDREITCLNRQIEAEQSLERGEWKRDVRKSEQLRRETRFKRFNV